MERIYYRITPEAGDVWFASSRMIDTPEKTLRTVRANALKRGVGAKYEIASKADYDAYHAAITAPREVMNRDRTEAAFARMQNIGGGFASALAIAWRKADLQNRRIIETAFVHLIESYTESEEPRRHTGG